MFRCSRWCAVRKRQFLASLTSAQRRKNVQGAFEVKDRASVKGKRILLIDDVLTTGATAGACARAFKRAGAAQVTLLTLARRDRRAGFESSVDLQAQRRLAQGVDSEELIRRRS